MRWFEIDLAGVDRAGERPLILKVVGFFLAASIVICSGAARSQNMPGIDCNLFGPTEACEPYLLYPPRQELGLTLSARDGEQVSAPDYALNTLKDLFTALRACWFALPGERSIDGLEATVRFSLNREGAIIGKPRFTYTKRDAPAEDVERYRKSILQALGNCTPLHLSEGLGGAIAGRPIVLRFIEPRR